ncbi:MAG TPA: nucleoside-triphosphatase [Pseudonocardiaceae bacterium]|nr:nucleoside-triphosphatase [Pseudonocardiaceae bacterium]
MGADRTALHPFRLLLEGPPKVGKTTVVEQLVKLLAGAGVPVGGFVTREVVGSDGRRIGFKVHDLAGPEAWIAHQDFDTGIRVGRFGVDKVAFEQVALVALQRAARLARDQDGVAIIDEIARMELTSADFTQSIETIFARPAAVVATVHVSEHPVTDALKRRSDIELITVTEVNRDDLPSQLFHQLASPATHGDPV